MIKVTSKGDFHHTERLFERALSRKYLDVLHHYAELGVEALRAATPVSSGATADAWGYEIESGDGRTTISFTNSHENNGVNIAILLIYGHGTANGTYVEGVDFVTPALAPVFKQLADQIWMEVRI